MKTLESLISGQPRDLILFDFSPYEPAIAASIGYLESPEALSSIEINPYWPKWNSPWWHMSALFEAGLADRIPKSFASRMLAEIKATHLPYFFRAEAPAGRSPRQDAPCPCAFGNIYQILSAVGLPVDAELPWARDWFLKYQMPDGGLSCDEEAHRADPGASSIVGTIAPLEAILAGSRLLTPRETQFLDLGAQCLLERELRLGSSSHHNAEERLDEADWLKPCFPRLYFYDVLRGLNFVLDWAEKLDRPIPSSAITEVVAHLCLEFPDGKVRLERLSYEGVGNHVLNSSGIWESASSASTFPLLLELSKLDQLSPFLTAKWQKAVEAMDRLLQKGLIQ